MGDSGNHELYLVLLLTLKGQKFEAGNFHPSNEEHTVYGIVCHLI